MICLKELGCVGVCVCIVAVVQLVSCVQLFATPRTAARQAPLSSTISSNCLKFMAIESVMISNNLIVFHLRLLLPASMSFQ